jgi:hypothetical protein
MEQKGVNMNSVTEGVVSISLKSWVISSLTLMIQEQSRGQDKCTLVRSIAIRSGPYEEYTWSGRAYAGRLSDGDFVLILTLRRDSDHMQRIAVWDQGSRYSLFRCVDRLQAELVEGMKEHDSKLSVY